MRLDHTLARPPTGAIRGSLDRSVIQDSRRPVRLSQVSRAVAMIDGHRIKRYRLFRYGTLLCFALASFVAVPEVLQEPAEQDLWCNAKDVCQVKKLENIQFALANLQVGHAALFQLEGFGEIVLRECRSLALLSEPSSHAATIDVTWHAVILKGCTGVLKNSMRWTAPGS